MSAVNIKRGETVRLGKVNASIKVGNNATIVASEGSLVSISGEAFFEGAAVLNCDFECHSLRGKRGAFVKSRGNLTVRDSIDVDHSVESSGKVTAQKIDVGGKVSAKEVSSKQIRVGGAVETSENLSAEQVDVGGKVIVGGVAKIQDLGVGGKVIVGGGRISGSIRVGGSFESRGDLAFGDLQSFGRTDLLGDSNGIRIATFGKMIAKTRLDCDDLVVDGLSRLKRKCTAKRIVVKGKLIAQEEIEASESIEVQGTAEASVVRSTEVKIGGKFRARKIIARGAADLAGFVETKEGLQGNSVNVRSGSRCKGPLFGEQIEIGKSSFVLANLNKSWYGQSIGVRLVGRMTSVEDVHGREVYLGEASQSRNVYGEVIEVSRGAEAQQVCYTRELRGAINEAKFGTPPKKVADLPASSI